VVFSSGEDVDFKPGAVDAKYGPTATTHDGAVSEGNQIQVCLGDGRYLYLRVDLGGIEKRCEPIHPDGLEASLAVAAAEQEVKDRTIISPAPTGIHAEACWPLTSSQWQKQPAVAYRQYDGQHFKLGMTFAVIMRVLEDMFEWKSYNPGHARVKKGKCWINEHGPEISTYDCTEILVPDFVIKHGLRDLAISGVLWSEGAKEVGPSDVFFSHCQNMSLHIMLQTLRDALPIYREQLGREPRFFVDLFCIRQCHKKTEFDLAVVRQAPG
jgi:hypothetical protein